MKIQKTYGIYLFSFSLFWALWLQLTAGPTKQVHHLEVETWFLSPKETIVLPDFKIIDTRSVSSRFTDQVANAHILGWEDLSQKESPFRGKLQSIESIHKKLFSLGFNQNDTILVLGDGTKGWGEEGRIVWSLREVGFSKTFWFNGKISSFKEILETRKRIQGSDQTKSINLFTTKPKTPVTTNITKEEITKHLPLGTYQILDTREPREYLGSTPYGESRGGHIPGAKLYYYQNLFDDKGHIKSKDEVVKTLTSLGITKSKPIIAYCTGGVRSAFVVGILRSYGFNAYNYSGSMWEWSFNKDLPLEK
ncbi:sulfurtransferase [Leptospira sp. WS39.C2]